MDNQLSKRRMMIVLGALLCAFLIVLFASVIVLRDPQTSDSMSSESTTSVTSTTTMTTHQSNGTGSTTASISTDVVENDTDDTTRYAYPTVTQVDWLTTYRKTIEFDGWELYLDNLQYDESRQELTFEMQQLTTRKNAQPIYFDIQTQGYDFGDPIEDRQYTQTSIPVPYVSPLYRDMDHLQVKRLRVTVQDVAADFGAMYINCETMSIADDVDPSTGGKIVTQLLLINMYDLP